MRVETVKWVVVDWENKQAFGPYDSEGEATADIIVQANKDSWTDIIEAGDFPFEDTGLVLIALFPPEGTSASR